MKLALSIMHRAPCTLHSTAYTLHHAPYLPSKLPQVCIVALTACILEMSGSMYALLPEVGGEDVFSVSEGSAFVSIISFEVLTFYNYLHT